MRRVVYLTAAHHFDVVPRDPEERREHELQFERLRRGCGEYGIELIACPWSADDLPTAEAFVIGTAWDYIDRPRDFLRRLDALELTAPVFNPVATVRWNLEKTYLRDIATRGVATVPTLWIDDANDIGPDVFDALETDEIVVKPLIGAHSWRQARLRRDAELPARDDLPPANALVQPFLPAICEEGEYSFVFFDREFSHCVRKMPAPGDYRIQASYGGRERAHESSEHELARARAVLESVDGPLLQARVDLIRAPNGDLCVIELELIEPFLFPEHGPVAHLRFARALASLMECR